MSILRHPRINPEFSDEIKKGFKEFKNLIAPRLQPRGTENQSAGRTAAEAEHRGTDGSHFTSTILLIMPFGHIQKNVRDEINENGSELRRQSIVVLLESVHLYHSIEYALRVGTPPQPRPTHTFYCLHKIPTYREKWQFSYARGEPSSVRRARQAAQQYDQALKQFQKQQKEREQNSKKKLKKKSGYASHMRLVLEGSVCWQRDGGKQVWVAPKVAHL
eukprot:gene13056-biopygen320